MTQNCRAENPKTCRVHGKNHYKTLGIETTATVEEIKKAYKFQIRKTHPDMGGLEDDFIAVQKAYEILINPTTKAKYDSESVEEHNYDSYDERFYNLKEQLYQATDEYKAVQKSIDEKHKLLDELRRIPSTRPNIVAHINRIEYVLSGLNYELYFHRKKMESIFGELKKYHKV